MNDFHGLLVIDKPLGITSRAALDAAARWFPRGTKIGHTGTLDPLATGVLVLCVGAATRLADFIQAMPKSYESEFTLGATSATDDAEGPIELVSGPGVPGFPGAPSTDTTRKLDDDTQMVELQVFGLATIYEDPDAYQRIKKTKESAPPAETTTP